MVLLLVGIIFAAQGLRPVLGVVGFVGDVPGGSQALIAGEVGPEEGGDAYRRQIQGTQQGGLEGVTVFVGK